MRCSGSSESNASGAELKRGERKRNRRMKRIIQQIPKIKLNFSHIFGVVNDNVNNSNNLSSSSTVIFECKEVVCKLEPAQCQTVSEINLARK